MNILKKLSGLFTLKRSSPAPVVIIKKDSDDTDVKEFTSIEEAISDLESDPNVPLAKIEKLRSSLKKLKNKTSIKIRNGEILK